VVLQPGFIIPCSKIIMVWKQRTCLPRQRKLVFDKCFLHSSSSLESSIVCSFLDPDSGRVRLRVHARPHANHLA